ncbi:hypothetical protein PsorP6_010193 [Peronosclerospora sorghi]|uniref:Uncharacterized protein n=1 Tax=Peronosclerospora sorghi TaxID=230839 RepID=A0ACC0VWT0_9STRA|nr:hypothetical protein PsorP6_010193 [Peronosclerospora sorghi]
MKALIQTSSAHPFNHIDREGEASGNDQGNEDTIASTPKAQGTESSAVVYLTASDSEEIDNEETEDSPSKARYQTTVDSVQTNSAGNSRYRD